MIEIRRLFKAAQNEERARLRALNPEVAPDRVLGDIGFHLIDLDEMDDDLTAWATMRFTKTVLWIICAFCAAVLSLILLAKMTLAHATWRPEYGQNSEAIMAWFKAAAPTEAATRRIGFTSCCEHSDRFRTKFKVSRASGQDEWSYEQNGRWLPIPSDVIHVDGVQPPAGHEHDLDFLQLEAEGVLFIYPPIHGQPTCFWPPNGGG